MVLRLSTLSTRLSTGKVINIVGKSYQHYQQVVDNLINIVDNFTGTIEYMVTASIPGATNFNVFVAIELYFYSME